MIIHSRKTCTIDLTARTRLINKLSKQAEIFGFTDDPALASLCCALGLQFEMGRADYDRLSPFFGVDIHEFPENPWQNEIFINDNEFGIKLWRKDGMPLQIKHQDLAYILDPESLDANGVMTQAVIYPSRVARYFKTRGFDLVIVRDWILSSALNLDSEKQVGYLIANNWEVENNIALTQARLMKENQLAFFGTHDIVDHLLNADIEKFNCLRSLYDEVFATLTTARSRSNPQLIFSYLIGVLLDDLAQPRWYQSKKHQMYITQTLSEWKNCDTSRKIKSLELPASFHSFVECLRNPNTDPHILALRHLEFSRELKN